MTQAQAEVGKLNVFVSYSRVDIAFADQLVATLELAGFDPTIDRSDIHGAEKWEQKLEALIREADTVVLVLSPSSAKSKTCAWEVEQAFALNKRIVPVVCRPLDGIAPPAALEELNYIFFYEEPQKPGSGWASGLRELDKTLKTDLAWLREHTRLLQRALEWEAGGRFEGRLLSGQDILDAKGWVARQPANAPAPTEAHLAFIAASEARDAALKDERQRQLEERERLVREAEADRAAREAAQTQALAAAQLTARRTRMGLAAVSVLLIAVASVAGLAWRQREEAQSQRAEAIASKVRAENETKRAEDRAQAAQEAVKVVDIFFDQVISAAKVEQSREARDAEIFQKLSAEAEKNNRTAMVSVATLIIVGRGTKGGYSESQYWYEKAAAAGDTAGMYYLGFLNRMEQDFDKAREWYEKAATAGNARAMDGLGDLYNNVDGAPQDYTKAREWYEKAARAGIANAMANLGHLYFAGRGVGQDLGKAREWYEKAAVAGDADAMARLGFLYHSGQGVAQDYVKAREWYEKAAVAGDADAMANLGSLYGLGEGVAQDFGKAREWYEKAAKAGDASAMTNLGSLYGLGRGVTQDYGKAREWYENAAAAGSAVAMTYLGALYDRGHGVERDYAKARDWYERAAAAGDRDAMKNLGSLYDNGQGVSQDYVKATEWYRKAAAAGNKGVLGSLSWTALLAGEATESLSAVDKALAGDRLQLWIETNKAHALMYLGREDEARALYLANKNKPIPENENKPWQQVIAEDFAALRKAGREHPQMAEIEAALGIAKP